MDTDSLIGLIARHALSRLRIERSRGFREAAHRVVFSHKKGFTGETEAQTGDVFARSIIADALCDAIGTGDRSICATLDSECRYLVDRRQRSDPGGWSYFPGLPELPPDTDVLAEVMQVLIRCGRSSDLLSYVEPPLRAVLDSEIRPSGALGTWIVPRMNRSPLARRQAHFVRCAWGDTDDPDVMANFLFALTLYDPARFADVLARGSQFLLNRQTPEGCWISTWYVGRFYGTYVCTRALAALGQSPALGRALSFLIRSQCEDGGWGRATVCGQLDTALALCAMCVTLERLGVTTFDSERMHRGLEALADTLATRGWHASPFIRMDVGRSAGEAGPELRYMSSAINAAFALKAAMAVRRLLNNYSPIRAGSTPSQLRV